jgi:hypothetical protein
VDGKQVINEKNALESFNNCTGLFIRALSTFSIRISQLLVWQLAKK